MSTAQHNENNHENDEMYSIEEAAAFLRVPVATMRTKAGSSPHPVPKKFKNVHRRPTANPCFRRSERQLPATTNSVKHAGSCPGLPVGPSPNGTEDNCRSPSVG